MPSAVILSEAIRLYCVVETLSASVKRSDLAAVKSEGIPHTPHIEIPNNASHYLRTPCGPPSPNPIQGKAKKLISVEKYIRFLNEVINYE